MTASVFNSKPSQKGVTLVELMISMVITMIIMAGVVQVMVDNRQKFKLNDELSYIQENARFALDELGRDLRMAGFSGCGATTHVANVVQGAGTDFYDGFGLGGWDGAEASADFPTEFRDDLWSVNTAASPDAVVIKRVNSDDSFPVTEEGNNASAAVLKLGGDHDVQPGTIMVVVGPDCTQAVIFQNTQTNNSNNAEQLQFNTGNSVSPGNCIKAYAIGTMTCGTLPSPVPTKKIPKGSMVMSFSSQAYYIGASSIDASIPSLYRERVIEASNAATTTAEELLIGVENMQLVYGVDTDATADGVANRYLDADEIDGAGNREWERVVSVRIDLLLRSLDPIWNEDTDFTFDATTYSGRELRQRVSSTILLRNMAIVQ